MRAQTPHMGELPVELPQPAQPLTIREPLRREHGMQAMSTSSASLNSSGAVPLVGADIGNPDHSGSSGARL